MPASEIKIALALACERAELLFRRLELQLELVEIGRQLRDVDERLEQELGHRVG